MKILCFTALTNKKCMQKIIITIAILISNISYGANTRQSPVSAKCYDIGDNRNHTLMMFTYCEMTNGDICYVVDKGISCLKS